MRFTLRNTAVLVILLSLVMHHVHLSAQTSVPTTAPAQTAPSYDVFSSMWSLSLPWWEFILRGVIVYVFVLILLRITGKRQVGQLAPFDLVLLLVLSNAVQNAMNGGDNSISGGMISAITLVGLNYAVGWLTFKSKRIESLIEGHPLVLIHNGHVDHKIMNKARMTLHELNAALRAGGCTGPHEAKFAILENGGNITVVRNNGHEHVHTPRPHEHPDHHAQNPTTPPQSPP